MMLHVLPYVYLLIHPEVRETNHNIHLFNDREKEVFIAALELMVLFDIKIKEDSSNALNHIPNFEPDISNITTFGNGKMF